MDMVGSTKGRGAIYEGGVDAMPCENKHH